MQHGDIYAYDAASTPPASLQELLLAIHTFVQPKGEGMMTLSFFLQGGRHQRYISNGAD
jgi:hypothetical protein